MPEFTEAPSAGKRLKKITRQRLKNIGLYYLKRFESSVENLRQVLRRRVDGYARQEPGFNRQEAYGWIEDILQDFEGWHYLDDTRYAELKIRDYLNAGKPERYIKNKLRQKGISETAVDGILKTQDYDPRAMALKLARRKKIGPFRPDDQSRRENRRKDMAALIRAGFDYDIVCDILETSAEDLADGTDI